VITNTTDHLDIDHINEFKERWPYTRPNFVTFCNTSGRYFNEGTYETWLPEGEDYKDYIILTDHNRAPTSLSVDRIGSNKRMINANMRTYHIADKLTIPLSWTDIPSRSFSTTGGFAAWKEDQLLPRAEQSICKFTADGGAGGIEMLDWYQRHRGSFWAFFNFDSYPVSAIGDTIITKGYSRVYEMVVTDFTYDIKRRSHGYHFGDAIYAVDMCDLSMTLEEV